MPGSNSIAKTLSKGMRLSAAISQNAEHLTLPEPQKSEFDQALAQFQGLLTRRDNLQAEKQTLSRQLAESNLRLNNATINTKSMIKALMGSTNERLTEFEIKPRRQVTVADRKAQKSAAREKAKKKAEEAARAGLTTATATPAAPAVPATPAETQG